MAAVRAGAAGFSRHTRFTVYSSTTAHDWKDSDEKRTEGEGRDRRNGKGYGVSTVSAETVRKRWKQRKDMLEIKLKFCDWSLFFALFGLLLAVLDVELCALEGTVPPDICVQISTFLRAGVIGSTIILQIVLVAYHFMDIKIYLNETGNENCWVAFTWERISQILIEMAVCAICPMPHTGIVDWPLLTASAREATRRIQIPISVLLTLPMFLRLYILGRYMLLHSTLYQDCAARTIASFNQISVDFRFVVRSQLYSRPLFVVSVFTVCFWVVMSWMLTQCERYAAPKELNLSGYHHLLDFIWFEIITFFSIGYGDIKAHTYCGRALAMLTALVGTMFSSILIALMGRRMALSSGEKRVNHIIAESQLTHSHRDAAARVLQQTWRTVLRRREAAQQLGGRAVMRLSNAQRGLLRAVMEFRRTRWRLRMRLEDEEDYFVARRAFMETEDRLSRVRMRQAHLNEMIGGLYNHVQQLTNLIQITQVTKIE